MPRKKTNFFADADCRRVATVCPNPTALAPDNHFRGQTHATMMTSRTRIDTQGPDFIQGCHAPATDRPAESIGAGEYRSGDYRHIRWIPVVEPRSPTESRHLKDHAEIHRLKWLRFEQKRTSWAWFDSHPEGDQKHIKVSLRYNQAPNPGYLQRVI